MRRFVIVMFVVLLSGVALQARAYAVDGYTLTLTVSPGGSQVHAGDTLTYTIQNTQPQSSSYVTYRFATPLGTTFVSAQAVRGATVSAINPNTTPAMTNPVGQGGVFIDAGPTAPESEVVVKVRVNQIWQGTVTAKAWFLATGLGASNEISQSVALGEGVPGQLVAHRFIDLNGNGQLDPEDFPMSCEVDVYAGTLAEQRIPDGVASPQDPRLPLVAFGETDDTGTARINLLPSRYVVYYSGCQAPGAPASFNSVDVIARPPLTRLHDVSGANAYDVQIVDIATTQITDVLYTDKPVLAPATGLRLDGLILTWTDNAMDETGYRVQIQSTVGGAGGVFDLPPNSTTFTIPSSLLTPCRHTSLQISVSPVDANGGVGVPAQTEFDSIPECLAPPGTAPNTGTGPQSVASSWPILAATLATIGAAAVAAGVLTRHLRRGNARSSTQ